MGICSHLLAHMGCGQPHLFGHLALSFCGVTCLLSCVAFALCRLALSFCRFPFVFRLLPLLFDRHGGYLLEKRTIGRSTLSKAPVSHTPCTGATPASIPLWTRTSRPLNRGERHAPLRLCRVSRDIRTMSLAPAWATAASSQR